MQKRCSYGVLKRIFFISAPNIPGKHNIEANIFSGKFNINTEWQLNPRIFIEITNKLGYPEIDLFSTRINTQLQSYVSWSCEPEAKRVDAFLTVSYIYIYLVIFFFNLVYWEKYPVGIYLLKVYLLASQRRSGVFIVNFEHISHLVLVFLFLTLNM